VWHFKKWFILNGLFNQIASVSLVLVWIFKLYSSHVTGPASVMPCLLRSRCVVQFATDCVDFMTVNESAPKIKISC